MKKYYVLLASLLAGVWSTSAQSVDVTVDGNSYDVTTVTTSFGDPTSTLAAQPWYGDSTLASDLATAVDYSLGYQTPASATYSPQTSTGPYFAYALDGNVLEANLVYSGLYVGYGPGTADTVTYAILAPVPESTANPVLLASAGLFIGWRGWRTIRAARA